MKEPKITTQLIEKFAKTVLQQGKTYELSGKDYICVLTSMLANTMLSLSEDAKNEAIYDKLLKEVVNFLENYPIVVKKALVNPELHSMQ